MDTTTNIIVRTQFPAIHAWFDCDVKGMEFLREPHRHVFHVEMKWQVGHDDREIEFIDMKSKVDSFIRDHWWENFIGSRSCEMLAKELMFKFKANYVSVFEDNENGAEIYSTDRSSFYRI